MRPLQAFLRRYARREARALLPHVAGRRLLDLGSGEGWVAEALLELAPPRWACAADVGAFGLASGPYVVYDGARLPFADDAFDTTLISLALHHAEKPETVLDEAACGTVKQERLAFLADNPFYTKRFAFYVGRRCRASPIKDVAKELRLDWHTVKDLEKQYMREQLRRLRTPAPRVIGIDEVSIKKRHTYRIVVSNLLRARPIWFGGQDRSEASMDEFFAWLGPRTSARIRLAVMDMWKPFRTSTKRHTVQASILFDKFHVLRHLGEALDTVRKSEYARLAGRDRRFIKGQKYTLRAHRKNLTLDGRRTLKTLLAANKRLNTAYLLKESFGQLWEYKREGWARRFFENWRAALKWQRLHPYEKFAEMIERHWDGIAAYCQPRNKVALGFVEGLNNKVRVIQRRAYGLRDEEYLRLKILTCMLPAL